MARRTIAEAAAYLTANPPTCLCDDCRAERADTWPRCEADRKDGGVCLARLHPSGACPRPEVHA